MKALIWKELREHFRWALLGLAALTAAELYALHHRRDNTTIDFFFNDGITLAKQLFLIVTMFGSAACGLALGLWQVLPELKRDRWASLLHRPVARGCFFWGKAIAGVLLYLFAVGGALLICTCHVATPGAFNVPFRIALVQPALADLVVGLAYYFAGLLMALEGRRALRVLPLLAAVHLTFFALSEKLFRVAVEAGVAMALVIALAGWGALLAPAARLRRPLLARLALLVVAFYGACGAGDLLGLLGSLAGRKGKATFSTWELLANGAPVQLSYVDEVLVSTRDPEGQPYTEPDFRPDRVRAHTLGMNLATWSMKPGRREENFYHASYRESRSYLSALQPYGRPVTEQWFIDWRANIFLGVRPFEKRTVAALGGDGFTPPNGPTRPFAVAPSFHQIGFDALLLVSDATFRIDLANRVVTQLPLPAPGPILGSGYCWVNTDVDTQEFVGVALPSLMAMYNRDGQVVAQLPYQHDTTRWGRISVGALQDPLRFILQAEPSRELPREEKKTMPLFVDVLDAEGHVVKAYTLPPETPYTQPPTWSAYVEQRLGSPGFFFGNMLYRHAGAALGSARLRANLPTLLGPRGQGNRDAALVFLPLALVLAGLTFRSARRAHLSPRSAWRWAGAVFVFGLPGFLVYLLAGERPLTVRCAACGHPRRIEEETCAHCGAPWTAPQPDGTEILDPLPTPALAAIA